MFSEHRSVKRLCAEGTFQVLRGGYRDFAREAREVRT